MRLSWARQPHQAPPVGPVEELLDHRAKDFDNAAMTAVDLVELLVELHRRSIGPWTRVRLERLVVEGDVLLGGFHTPLSLAFVSCTFTGSVAVDASRFGSLGMRGCTCGGLMAAGLVTDSDVDLRGCVIGGRVDLRAARVGGSVLLDDARIVYPGFDPAALWADHLQVAEHIDARRLVVSGGVRLLNAAVGTRINFEDATIAEQSASANADMEASGGRDGEGILALTLAGASAESLWLNFAQAPQGKVRLSGLSVSTLYDHPDTWAPGIDLTGFSYRQLIGRNRPEDASRNSRGRPRGDVPPDPTPREHEVPVSRRLDWLALNRPFSSEPYERLAAHYRSSGKEADARLVLLAQERRRRATRPLHRRLGGYILDLLVGYGYQNARAGVWLAALLVGGTACLYLSRPTPAGDGPAPEGGPLFQALDLLLPIVNLGQDGAWRYQAAGYYVSVVLVLSGWTLTTAVIAGISRLFNRR